ncbi:MAG: type II secretion system protein [Candidatus Pacebacteria bacterium]|nr:type II secretion system protein [Candidatus Paceibacterota bacterium]
MKTIYTKINNIINLTSRLRAVTSNGMITKNRKINKGFTLVELMVATSIFVVIMLASMGSLFTLLDASKTSRALRFAMDNVNFAMESMTRSIRMGTNYYCVLAEDTVNLSNLTDVKDCTSTSPGTLIAFRPQDPTATNKIAYKRSASGTSIERCGEGNVCVPIVSPDVRIDELKFIVNGSTPNDTKQASVYIIMKGSVLVKGIPSSFSIQTLASQRNF